MVGPVRRIRRQGRIVQASTALHFSANTGYRILVRAAGLSTSRVWVQAADGEYRELSGAGAVTVAHQPRGGDGEREVHYRIELPQGDAPSLALPVRYEIVIDPVI